MEETIELEETTNLVSEKYAPNMILVFVAVTICLLDSAAIIDILYYVLSKDWLFALNYVYGVFPGFIKIICIVYAASIIKSEFSVKRTFNTDETDESDECEYTIMFGTTIVFGIGVDIFTMFYDRNVFTIINGVFSSVSGLLLLACYCISNKIEK